MLYESNRLLYKDISDLYHTLNCDRNFCRERYVGFANVAFDPENSAFEWLATAFMGRDLYFGCTFFVCFFCLYDLLYFIQFNIIQ
jgi:hypothetical protein